MEPQKDLPWMQIARGELGVREIKGPDQNNARIIDYFRSTAIKTSTDETPWCAAFVNWCLMKAGINGTHSAAARSFMNWGKSIETPIVGCVAVLSRGGNPGQGHTGFFDGPSKEAGYVRILGGNQGDAVSIAEFHKTRILGYRVPKDFSLKDSSGKVLWR